MNSTEAFSAILDGDIKRAPDRQARSIVAPSTTGFFGSKVKSHPAMAMRSCSRSTLSVEIVKRRARVAAHLLSRRDHLFAEADRGAGDVAAAIERLERCRANYLHRSAPVPAWSAASGLAAVSDGAVVVCARLSDGTAVFRGTL